MQDLGQDVIATDTIGERLVRQNQTVSEYIERKVSDILGQCVVSSTNEGQGLSGKNQVDRRAWTRPVRDVASQSVVADVGGIACRVYQLDRVFDERWVDVDGVRCLLEVFELVGVEYWFCLLYTSPSPRDRG